MGFDLTLILLILTAHFISDFLCQTEKVATSKGDKIEWLAAHAGVYTIILWFFMIFVVIGKGYFEKDIITIGQFATWVLLNGVFHFFIDGVSSRSTKQLWENDNKRPFFDVIGLDQLIHFVCLFWSWQIIIG